MKFCIYEKSLLDKHQTKNIISVLNQKGYKYSKEIKNIDYLFVFGGDGTFLDALKNYFHLEIKIILINAGRLGFLSSSKNYLDFETNKYKKFDYLEIEIDNKKFECINETIVTNNNIQNIITYINDIEFKILKTNQINIVNNLGSTGINRSNIKPLIFPWNHQYIIDVKNEPIYNYYKPLLQPLILSNTDNILFKLDNLIKTNIKIDNNFIFNNQIINKISVTQKQSNCSILNLDNPKHFFDKLNNLF